MYIKSGRRSIRDEKFYPGLCYYRPVRRLINPELASVTLPVLTTATAFLAASRGLASPESAISLVSIAACSFFWAIDNVIATERYLSRKFREAGMGLRKAQPRMIAGQIASYSTYLACVTALSYGLGALDAQVEQKKVEREQDATTAVFDIG